MPATARSAQAALPEPEYITDAQGQQKAVLPREQYERVARVARQAQRLERQLARAKQSMDLYQSLRRAVAELKATSPGALPGRPAADFLAEWAQDAA